MKHGWELLESIAKQLAEAPVWHATNREIYDYVQAWRGLIWTLDLHLVQNPSCTPVWLLRNDALREIPAGATVAF
jgi:hypothetical protein